MKELFEKLFIVLIVGITIGILGFILFMFQISYIAGMIGIGLVSISILALFIFDTDEDDGQVEPSKTKKKKGES